MSEGTIGSRTVSVGRQLLPTAVVVAGAYFDKSPVARPASPCPGVQYRPFHALHALLLRW
jgi:hypothetical protein